jgi:hypothetical protein
MSSDFTGVRRFSRIDTTSIDEHVARAQSKTSTGPGPVFPLESMEMVGRSGRPASNA